MNGLGSPVYATMPTTPNSLDNASGALFTQNDFSTVVSDTAQVPLLGSNFMGVIVTQPTMYGANPFGTAPPSVSLSFFVITLTCPRSHSFLLQLDSHAG